MSWSTIESHGLLESHFICAIESFVSWSTIESHLCHGLL